MGDIENRRLGMRLVEFIDETIENSGYVNFRYFHQWIVIDTAAFAIAEDGDGTIKLSESYNVKFV